MYKFLPFLFLLWLHTKATWNGRNFHMLAGEIVTIFPSLSALWTPRVRIMAKTLNIKHTDTHNQGCRLENFAHQQSEQTRKDAGHDFHSPTTTIALPQTQDGIICTKTKTNVPPVDEQKRKYITLRGPFRGGCKVFPGFTRSRLSVSLLFLSPFGGAAVPKWQSAATVRFVSVIGKSCGISLGAGDFSAIFQPHQSDGNKAAAAAAHTFSAKMR